MDVCVTLEYRFSRTPDGAVWTQTMFAETFWHRYLDVFDGVKVVARAEPYILSPQLLYECTGDVPNVVFPCASLVDGATGRIAVYYGAADTVTCLAFARTDELIDFVKENAV